ncbi:MAG TPA: hypothetical protein VGF86_11470 [Candidatus Tumulicola sp.]|jgi:hypothetical protein
MRRLSYSGRTSIVVLVLSSALVTGCSAPANIPPSRAFTAEVGKLPNAIPDYGGGPANAIPPARLETLPSKGLKRHISARQLKWILATSNSGRVVATCPTGWTMIAGGSTTADGGNVGTGTPSGNGWATVGTPSETVYAYASCARNSIASNFVWVGPYKMPAGQKEVFASCPTNGTLIMGYAVDESYEAAVYPKTGNDSWAAGGRPSVKAWAACTTYAISPRVINVWGPSQYPGHVLAGCPSAAPTVIGGSMGDAQGSSFFPGPPTAEFPKTKAGQGWSVYSGISNVLARAVCL